MGTLFSLGVCLPVFVDRLGASEIVMVLIMAILFIFNCTVVATAQRMSDREQEIVSFVILVPRFVSLQRVLILCLVGLALMFCWAGVIPGAVALAVAISGGALWCVCRRIGSTSWAADGETAYFADYALLLGPLAVWLISVVSS